MASKIITTLLITASLIVLAHSQDEETISPVAVSGGHEEWSCLNTLRLRYTETEGEGQTPIGQNCTDLCTGANGSHSDGIFAHPGNCLAYIQCTNWEAVARLCPDTQYFDDTIAACAFVHLGEEEKKNEQCERRQFKGLPPTTTAEPADLSLILNQNPTEITVVKVVKVGDSQTTGAANVIPTADVTAAPTEAAGDDDTTLSSNLSSPLPNDAMGTTSSEFEEVETTPGPPRQGIKLGILSSGSRRRITSTTMPITLEENPLITETYITRSAIGSSFVPASVQEETTTRKPAVIRSRYYLPGTLYRLPIRRPRL